MDTNKLSPSSDASAPVGHRTAVLRSPLYAGHDNPQHPENQRRLKAIDADLERADLLADRPLVAFGEAQLADVERIHNPWYVERLDRLSMGGGAWLDQDTYITPDTYDIALTAAGAAVAAVDAVMDQTAPSAFVLSRPPGHHATPERGMGFCLFNNIAIAAGHALDRGLERVAVVDWDVHHGNGTQDAFYGRSDVLFISLHQEHFYPGTGEESETGDGKGAGYTRNLTMPPGSGDVAYLERFDSEVLPALRAYRPELVLVSAGYDAHADDPIGGMVVTEAGFAAMAERLRAIADETASGRIVAILEGGYDPAALARSVVATLESLDRDAV